MSETMRYVHDVLEERQHDTFFLQLEPLQSGAFCEKTRARCLEWFAAQGCKVEQVVPLGHLEGDTGLYYVDFDGLADAKTIAWMEEFENEDGSSLEPDLYKMIIVPWEVYQRDMQPQYREYIQSL